MLVGPCIQWAQQTLIPVTGTQQQQVFHRLTSVTHAVVFLNRSQCLTLIVSSSSLSLSCSHCRTLSLSPTASLSRTVSLSISLRAASIVIISVYTHTHILVITLHYTCCYDEIKVVKFVHLMLMLSMILSGSHYLRIFRSAL